MRAYLQWNCDFCKKPCITMSSAGILYCDNCKKSYGEQPFHSKEFQEKFKQLVEDK